MKYFLIASLGILLAGPVMARPHICQPVVDAQLREAGVAQSSIASTTIERDVSGGEDPATLGYTYWMRMKACQQGYLLVTLYDNCQPIGKPETVGGCEIAGVEKC